MSNPANTTDQNLLPVQAYFDEQGDFQTFIGQNKPFYATVSPDQSGLHITDSTIDSSVIGGTTPAEAHFTTATASNAPVGATDLVNKLYADALAAGISFKNPVLAATTENITLSGAQTIDTVSVAAGQRVLVKDQDDAAENGIYVSAAGAWARSEDANTWNELISALVFIEEGSQGGSAWYCTATQGGTLGVTDVNWSNFSIAGVYFAGTGLSLAANTFSISNTGVTAASYGSASKSVTLAVNAQGQITSASATDIAISATQITSGNIDSARLSGSYTGITGVGTLTDLTVTNTITGSVSGSAGSATTAGTATQVGHSLTINDSGSGSSSGATFNGSADVTISYNTIGAPKADGTGASGTWGISISGSAGSASSATTASNLSGGAAGKIPYQTGSGATSFTDVGSSGQVLSSNAGTAPTWIGASAFLDNISSTQGVVLYRNSTSWSALAPTTAGYLLQTGGAGANPSWVNPGTLTVSAATTATNLAGGGAGYLPYQSAANTTTLLAPSTDGKVLTLTSGVPTWETPSAAGVSITDDTTTNSTRYPLFTSVTTGSITTEYTSSTKYQFNPSTGILTVTGGITGGTF